MFKKTSLLIMVLLCGCNAQARLHTGSASSAEDGIVSATGNLGETRLFSAGQEQTYKVKTDQPLVVGFDVDLPSGLTKKIIDRAIASGDFDDNYAGK